jgi:hypothetical protein
MKTMVCGYLPVCALASAEAASISSTIHNLARRSFFRRDAARAGLFRFVVVMV